ncbi:hypothetical protein C7G83_00650 [Siccibacter turicensis]|uniref:Uncharacterized protein n=1 Tax=Siccibacter turicensis TaxID=357233 RepID=A0A2P8VPH0_9ENTR|nr:hypothetical protein C7G83_00650 [Siccibacter turicensis]
MQYLKAAFAAFSISEICLLPRLLPAVIVTLLSTNKEITA